MPTVEELDELRMRLLEAAYDEVNTDRRSRGLSVTSWAKAFEVDAAEARAAMLWLNERGLAAPTSLGGGIAPTTRGSDLVEERRRAPKTDDGDAATVISIAEHRQVEILLKSVQRLLEEHEADMAPEDAEDLRAQVQTIEAQNRSPRPRRGVIRVAVGAIQWVAERGAAGVAGNTAFQVVVDAASRIFG